MFELGDLIWLISANSVLQMLKLAIMPQCTEIGLANSRIVLTRVPNPLDHLRQTNIICLKLVKAPHHQQSRNVQRPVEELPQPGVLGF